MGRCEDNTNLKRIRSEEVSSGGVLCQGESLPGSATDVGNIILSRNSNKLLGGRERL